MTVDDRRQILGQEFIAGAGITRPRKSLAQYHAYRAFYSAIREQCPEFFSSLESRVYPHYLACADRLHFDIENWLWPYALHEIPDVVAQLLLALEEWADEFHAQVPFIYLDALSGLRAWFKDERWHQQLLWFAAESPYTLCFPLNLPDLYWDSSEETGEHFKKRVALAAIRHAKVLVKQVEEQPRARFRADHMAVFVQHQLLGQSAGSIAERLDKEHAEVRRVIRRIAKLLDWPRHRLFRAKPGRPSKRNEGIHFSSNVALINSAQST